MNFRRRHTAKTIDPAQVKTWQEAFFAAGGPALRLMAEMSENVPNVSLTLKNADLRIMFTNSYNVRVSGWRSLDDMLGYTSEELYPPDQAAVYTGRDREVLETGVPIVERVYGFVADRSTALNCVTVRPIEGIDGTRIGTEYVVVENLEPGQTAKAAAFEDINSTQVEAFENARFEISAIHAFCEY